MNSLDRIVDGVLETAVVPSFSRVGFATRSRLEHWSDPVAGAEGLVAVITGGTSGLGLAAARRLLAEGASVVLVGRNPDKTADAADRMRREGSGGEVHAEIADLSRLEDVRQLAERLADRLDRIDVLAHVAGTMLPERELTVDGRETTVAVSVLAPFLLTRLCFPLLQESPDARVITMSSGGMYTAPLLVEGLEMAPEDYSGVRQYALAKRAQVTLNELWAEHWRDSGVSFHALHPGWADTPGLESALPGFRTVTKPLLRTPSQGTDTLLWLTTADLGTAHSGAFWHDRHVRPIHRLRSTRRSDTPQRRARFWDWCETCA
ncbi:MAG: SDR family NAD(P)-dependent oxidoreductase [Acidimicrobiales bacterium]